MAPTIDSQVHAYERNRPERPWSTIVPWPDEVNGDDMVAAMDAVGIDGALLISPFSMYRYDGSYALEHLEGTAKDAQPYLGTNCVRAASKKPFIGLYGRCR